MYYGAPSHGQLDVFAGRLKELLEHPLDVNARVVAATFLQSYYLGSLRIDDSLQVATRAERLLDEANARRSMRGTAAMKRSSRTSRKPERDLMERAGRTSRSRSPSRKDCP